MDANQRMNGNDDAMRCGYRAAMGEGGRTVECRALWVVILMIGALGAGARGAETKEEGSGMLVYFGTSTGGSSGSRGIYVSRFDAEKGTLSEPKVAAETIRPSFLAGHPKLDVLYACSEVNVARRKST